MNNEENRNVITLLRERGNGATLVLFLPGLDGNLSQWDLVTPQLEDIPANLAHGHRSCRIRLSMAVSQQLRPLLVLWPKSCGARNGETY